MHVASIVRMLMRIVYFRWYLSKRRSRCSLLRYTFTHYNLNGKLRARQLVVDNKLKCLRLWVVRSILRGFSGSRFPTVTLSIPNASVSVLLEAENLPKTPPPPPHLCYSSFLLSCLFMLLYAHHLIQAELKWLYFFSSNCCGSVLRFKTNSECKIVVWKVSAMVTL